MDDSSGSAQAIPYLWDAGGHDPEEAQRKGFSLILSYLFPGLNICIIQLYSIGFRYAQKNRIFLLPLALTSSSSNSFLVPPSPVMRCKVHQNTYYTLLIISIQRYPLIINNPSNHNSMTDRVYITDMTEHHIEQATRVLVRSLMSMNNIWKKYNYSYETIYPIIRLKVMPTISRGWAFVRLVFYLGLNQKLKSYRLCDWLRSS